MYVNNYREIYNNLFNLFSEYLISIDRSFLMFGFYTSLAKIYYIIIKELNTFSERKTNIGLFNLKSNLLILINIDSKLESINRMLPKNMKIDCNDDL